MKQIPIIPGYELPENRPSELKRDPWLSRFFLQDVDDWILKEAERREDTWEFLVRVPCVTGNTRDFIKAGVGYSNAIRKLIEIDLGWTTLHRPKSVWDEAREADVKGDGFKAREKARKLIRGLLKNNCVVACIPPGDNESEKNKAWRLESNRVIEKEISTFRKKHGHEWREEQCFKPEDIDRQWNETQFMVHSWLRGSPGSIGLCFFTDEAIADLMTLLFCNENEGDRSDYYRKMRRSLGLKQIGCRKPTIKMYRRVPGTRFIEIEYRTKEGLENYSFEWHPT